MASSHGEMHDESGRPRLLRGLARWVFGLAVLPCVLLLLLEGGLRLGGFGVARQPFMERSVAGETFHVFNTAYLHQFFAQPMPHDPFAVPASKAGRAFRIAVLGGSAAQGWPDARYAFHALLELQLRAAYPGIDFQILNCAAAGLNLHAMRPIARALGPLKPDLVIVYAGNNEFQGPYALDTFHQAGRIPGANAIERLIALRNWRTMQLLERVAPRRATNRPPALAPGKAANDALKSQVYANFETNLRAITKAATQLGATPVLCTVPVNMREWPPLDPPYPPSLPRAALVDWQAAIREGDRALDAGRPQAAADHYKRAITHHEERPALHFGLARALFELGQTEEARPHFERALELDLYDFARCRPTQNDLVRQVAQELDVPLVDVLDSLAAQAPGRVPGTEFFYDACHNTFEGTYAIAMTVYDGIQGLLPPRVRAHAAGGSVRLTLEDMATYLAYSSDTARSPLQWLLDNVDSVSPVVLPYLRAAEEKLRLESPAPPDEAARIQGLERGRARCGNAPLLLEPLAEIHLRNARLEEARPLVDLLLAAQPSKRKHYLLHGRTLLLEDQPAAATRQIADGIALLGHDIPLLSALIDAATAAGNPQRALAAAELGNRVYPGDAGLWSRLYAMRLEQGDAAGAAREFARAIAEPALAAHAWQSHAESCAHQGDLEGAREAFLKAAQARGGLVDMELAMGLLEVEKALLDPVELIEGWEERVAEAPGNPTAGHMLARALESVGRFTEAVEAYREVMRQMPGASWMGPELASALREEAASLHRAGQWDRARDAFEEARALDPAATASLDEEGAVLEELGDIAAAHAAFAQNYAAETDNIYFARRLFTFEQTHFTPEEVAAHWEARVRAQPQEVIGQFFLGRAHVLAGAWEEAREVLERVRQRDAAFPELDQALAELPADHAAPPPGTAP